MRLLSWLGLVLFFLLCLGYFFYSLQPVSGMPLVKDATATSTEISAPAQFKILKGETFRGIGARLSQQELIRSITVFKFYALIAGRAQKFQPGLYTLSRSMSVPQIVDILTAGGKSDVTVTIPEGYTVKDIDAALRTAGVLENSSLIESPWRKVLIDYPPLAEVDSLEGLLFPDTYRFKLQSTPEEVLRMFLDNFKAKAWSLLDGRSDWYNRLILASFLEREVRSFEDRRVVADILLRRFKIRMPLQVDATVSYAKCYQMFTNCKDIQIVKNDLTSPSLYNTYQRIGWTPTPIANPGQSALRAAIDPAANSYLYYFSGETGETIFSKTLDGHNENRRKYQ